MPNELPTFFDHSRHRLWVRDLDAALDVLAFSGEERLSEPFCYTIGICTSASESGCLHSCGDNLVAFQLNTPTKTMVPGTYDARVNVNVEARSCASVSSYDAVFSIEKRKVSNDG
jgi:uncharacterized protein involved in type VI secretion and phage assembly